MEKPIDPTRDGPLQAARKEFFKALRDGVEIVAEVKAGLVETAEEVHSKLLGSAHSEKKSKDRDARDNVSSPPPRPDVPSRGKRKADAGADGAPMASRRDTEPRPAAEEPLDRDKAPPVGGHRDEDGAVEENRREAEPGKTARPLAQRLFEQSMGSRSAKAARDQSARRDGEPTDDDA